jgi:hypothetical protein
VERGKEARRYVALRGTDADAVEMCRVEREDLGRFGQSDIAWDAMKTSEIRWDE